MQRRVFIFDLAPGAEQEYIRRHRQIWPEMLTLLQQSGIGNYSIWLWDGKVIGYYESEDLAATDAYRAQSPVQARWSEYMRDILLPAQRDGRALPPAECVFFMR